MSEEGEKPAAAAAPKKGRLGLIIGIVIAVVTLVGGSVAGAVLGPRLLGSSEESEASGKHGKSEKGRKADKSSKSEHGEEAEKDEGEGVGKLVTFDIPSVVVDLRDGDNRIRHLKVGLTAEIGEHTPAEELKIVVPRAREAAITFLRSLSFEDVSDPQHFTTIKDELSKRVIESLGEERVHRIVLTDFVVQ